MSLRPTVRVSRERGVFVTTLTGRWTLLWLLLVGLVVGQLLTAQTPPAPSSQASAFDVPGTITALGALVTALGVIIIAFINARSASKARAAEAAAQLQREAMAKAAAEAAGLAAKAAEEASKATEQLVIIDGKIMKAREAMDGRMTQLIEQIEKRAHAEGKAEGKTEEKADEKDRKSEPPSDTKEPVDVKIVDTKGHVPVIVKEPRK